MTVVFGVRGDDGRALSRPLLSAAVRAHWGWQELPPLERSHRGKPEFSGRPGCWMSLSHSRGYALCALSDDGPVGVDIEVVRPHRAALPRRVMSDAEFDLFDGTLESFTRIWTMKESFCKMNDSPLYPPRNVPTPPDCPFRSWSGTEWQATVCCQGLPPEEICWIDVP